jgi:hypothetical protein
VAALWPSHYPYSQAPNINSQQQSKDSISSQHASGEAPSAPVDVAREQQHQRGSENTSDTAVLGIKPGEWLLAIVTWMLWLATVRLVREGKNTAERQLRAYVFIDSAQVVNVIDGNGSPEAHVVIKNYVSTCLLSLP